MPSISALSSVAASLAVLHGVHAAFDNTSSANVAVYWGWSDLTHLPHFSVNKTQVKIRMARELGISLNRGYPTTVPVCSLAPNIRVELTRMLSGDDIDVRSLQEYLKPAHTARR